MLLVVMLALFSIPAGSAEDPAAMPEPTPEHEALGAWVGTWSGSGELKPGPFGPGGSMSWTEECSWFGDARFNVVCKSKGTGPMGPMKGLGIMGYDTEKKVYKHFGIDTYGWMGGGEGTHSGDTWTFGSTETMDGKTYDTRFSMKWVSPTRMTFSWDISEDGKTWTTLMEGTSEKK